MLDEKTRNEVFSCVETAVEGENFFEYKIELTLVEDRFIYEGCDLIACVTITGKDHNGHNLHMDLVMKLSEKCKSKTSPIRKSYRREMFLHQHVFVAMDSFMRKKRGAFRDHLNIRPVYYSMFSTEDREVLLFNELKKLGYVTSRGKLYTTQSNMYIILKNMAKFHGMTLAFRDQNPKEFEELMKQWQPDTKDLLLQPSIESKLKIGLNMALDILTDENRIELRNRLKKDIENGVLAVIENVLSNVPDEYVIVHGDCWMNNIMSKEESCENIKLIYWQMSTVHSPVLDLAYFLYFTHSEETNEYFESYVEYYHSEFTEYVKTLGSDPQVLFPFTKLLDHLLKYSSYALMMAMGGIPFIIVNNYLNNVKCLYEHCEHCQRCENCDEQANCERSENYELLKYENLKGEIKIAIKEKLIGILELHYKYFIE